MTTANQHAPRPPMPSEPGMPRRPRYWSINTKLALFLAPLILLILVAFAWFFLGGQRITLLEHETTAVAEALLTQIQAVREYQAAVLESRLATAPTSINPGYSHTPTAFPPPSWSRQEASQLTSRASTAYQVKQISPWPINQRNSPQDAFQREGLQVLMESGESVYSRRDTLGDVPVMRILALDRAVSQSCISCHNNHPTSPKHDFQVNDVIGAIEVTIPIESSLKLARKDQLWVIWGGAGVGLMVILLIMWGTRHVVTKPLRSMINQIRGISQSKREISEPPPLQRQTERALGEEFRELWHGFWDMHLQLRGDQQSQPSDLEGQAAALQLLNKRLLELQRISQILQQAISEEEVYRILTHSLQQGLTLQQILILRLNASEDRLEIVWTYPKREDLSLESYPVWNDPTRCPVIRSGREYKVHDVSRDLTCTFSLSNHEPGAYWCVPLVIGGRTIGVVHLVSSQPHCWTEDTCKWIEALISVAAPMIGHLQHLARAKRRALIDELTGTYNRRFMEETLSKFIVPDDRRRHQTLSLLVIDLDHFKRVNDVFGHPVGDLALKSVATTLHRTLKASDVLARYGGDEFVVVLPRTDTNGAIAVAERLRVAVAGLSLRTLAPAAPDHVTISVGVATYPSHALSIPELIRAADRALYQAKSFGRNRVVCAPDGLELTFDKPAEEGDHLT
ncbi:MAG: diguanylate cyclase [Nitrospiraceae bacterium]